jgi:hypothetical protein
VQIAIALQKKGTLFITGEEELTTIFLSSEYISFTFDKIIIPENKILNLKKP